MWRRHMDGADRSFRSADSVGRIEGDGPEDKAVFVVFCSAGPCHCRFSWRDDSFKPAHIFQKICRQAESRK